jgi:hypothetical protein
VRPSRFSSARLGAGALATFPLLRKLALAEAGLCDIERATAMVGPAAQLFGADWQRWRAGQQEKGAKQMDKRSPLTQAQQRGEIPGQLRLRLEPDELRAKVRRLGELVDQLPDLRGTEERIKCAHEIQSITNGMVRRLNLNGGIRGEQEASHGDSHDWHRSG